MRTLPIIAQFLAAMTMGLALAHALELPGKLRLDKRAYKTVQEIYYPGFTLGGLVGEFGAIVALLTLAYMTPFGTNRSYWTIAALLLMIAVHATYWILIHPINSFWVKKLEMAPAGARLFKFHAATDNGDANECWKNKRNVWETSHVIRAVLAALSFLAITVAVSL